MKNEKQTNNFDGNKEKPFSGNCVSCCMTQAIVILVVHNEIKKNSITCLCRWQQAQIFLKILHIKIVIKSAKYFNGHAKSQKYVK